MVDGFLHAVVLGMGLSLWLPTLRSTDWRARLAAVVVVEIYALRYWYWRVFDTLPPFGMTPGALWPWMFFAIETLSMLYLCWTAMILVRHADYTTRANASEAALRRAGNPPTVDVFIPTVNEPLEMLTETIRAAVRIDYPAGKLKFHVLDDDRSQEPGRVHAGLRDLCTRYRVEYHPRPDGRGAKAGNLNYGLAHSTGEVILVLDADFVADPRILWRTVGLLDERVALVQTPQHFANADTLQSSLGIARWAFEEQAFFFNRVLPSLSAWGSALCVGSGFVVRRAALDTNGFPTGALSEDVYLSFWLRARGFEVIHLNECLSRGMAADTASAWTSQRVRWSQGSLQFPFLPFGPLRAPGLRLVDRLIYASMSLYWVSQFGVLAAILLAPVVYFYSGVPAFHASLANATSYILPRLVSTSMVMFWLSDGRVMPVVSELRKMLGLPQILIGLASVLVSPFGKPFKVTQKVRSKHLVVNWDLLWPFAGLAIAVLVGMGFALWSDLGPVPHDEYLAWNLALGFYSAWLCLLTALACIDLPASALPAAYREPLRGKFWRAMAGLLLRWPH